MRLFLCDDNEPYRRLVRMVMAESHEIVGEASDGVEVLERAPALTPDVVLLDLNMPRMNGHEALPRLREAMPQGKIVVLTSALGTDDEARAMAAGADAYIAKPASIFSLPDELASALAAS